MSSSVLIFIFPAVSSYNLYFIYTRATDYLDLIGTGASAQYWKDALWNCQASFLTLLMTQSILILHISYQLVVHLVETLVSKQFDLGHCRITRVCRIGGVGFVNGDNEKLLHFSRFAQWEHNCITCILMFGGALFVELFLF